MGELLGLDTSFATTEPVTNTEKENENKNKENAEEEEEQEFEFRLFSAPEKSTNEGTQPSQTAIERGREDKDKEDAPHTQKLRIRVRSPTPGPIQPGEGRFVHPFRGWEYYFSTPGLLSSENAERGNSTDEARRSQFEDVVVTGAEMMRWANVDWVSCSTVVRTNIDFQPGCHLPWRVIHLKRQDSKLPSGSKSASYVADPPAGSPKSRKQPGKKRRVQLRKRAKTAELAKETDVEKRNRKNRERKIKRRQKARDMKAAAGDHSPTVGDMDDSQGESD